MAYLTRYGSAVGVVPATLGNIYYVNPGAGTYTLAGRAGVRSYLASDDHDGLSPERALATLQRAIDLATANVGDTIVLLEGTHTITTQVNVNKAGLTILGVHSVRGQVNPFKPKVVVRAATGGTTGMIDDLLNITVAGVELGYLELRPTIGFDAVCFETASALDGFYMHHCNGDLATPNVSTATRIINFTHRGARTGSSFVGLGGTTGAAGVISNVLIEDCVFEADGATGPAIELATCYGMIRRCLIYNTAGTWAIPVRVATAVDNFIMEDCTFMTSGTMTQCIDGTDATVTEGFQVNRCTFPINLSNARKPLDGFATSGQYTGEALVGECYIMTATGAVAVALIT